MPEHTPAPTPARSIYGFVMYLSFKTMFAIYMCWALIPDKWLHAMNITYYPQKYWAVSIPIQLLVALTLFAFFIYPSLNLIMTPDEEDIRTVTDNFALKRRSSKSDEAQVSQCDCKDKQRCFVEEWRLEKRSDRRGHEARVPHVEDLDIRDVCKNLYLR